MADIPRIKRNIQKMIDQGAPEVDIDSYVASEGVTLDQLKAEKQPNAAGDFVHKYIRPVLEIGGGMAGGVMAAPANIIAPGVAEAAGVAGGYMAGRQAANALEEMTGYKKPSGIVEAAESAISDIPAAATQGALGVVPGAAIGMAKTALAKQAPRLYESAMRIPPSVDKAARDKAVQTGLRYKVPVTEKGLEQVTGKIQSLNEEIASAIDTLATEQRTASAMNTRAGYKTYDENMIDMKAVVSRLDQLKQFYKESAPNPKPYLEAINQYKKDILSSRGKEMFADKAQKLKQGIYALHKKHYGEMKGIDVEMDKAVARGLKEELVNKYPELANLNAEDSALINLTGFLERAVNRTRNYDIIRLGDQIMTVSGGVVGGAPGAMVAGTLRNVMGTPAFKSKLAFALAKGAKKGGSPISNKAAHAMAYSAKDIVNSMKFPSLTNTAEAATPYNRRSQIDDAANWEAADRAQVATETVPQEEAPTISMRTVKKFSDGSYKRWDENEQAWMPLSQAERRKLGL